MAFKMKGPSMHEGTKAHKKYKELAVNKSMDDSSLPDGRAKSSAFQKKGKDKRSETEKQLQEKLDSRSSTYDYEKPSKETVKKYRETTKDGKDVNRTVVATADKTARQTIHKDKQ